MDIEKPAPVGGLLRIVTDDGIVLDALIQAGAVFFEELPAGDPLARDRAGDLRLFGLPLARPVDELRFPGADPTV